MDTQLGKEQGRVEDKAKTWDRFHFESLKCHSVMNIYFWSVHPIALLLTQAPFFGSRGCMCSEVILQEPLMVRPKDRHFFWNVQLLSNLDLLS